MKLLVRNHFLGTMRIVNPWGISLFGKFPLREFEIIFWEG